MKILTAATVAALSLLPTSGAWAQGGMMDGNNWGGHWMGSGYGGWVTPVLLVVLIGVIVWAVLRGRK